MILLKEFIRTLRSTLGRFAALTAIVTLGVAFFVGIRATGPDMRITADRYLDSCNIMDLRLISPTGFTNQDVAAVQAVDGVSQAEPAYAADVTANGFAIRLMSIGKINAPKLTEGRLPTKSGEILVDSKLSAKDFPLGSTVTINSTLNSQLSTLTVVGRAENPLFLAISRGSTKLGNGQLDGFFYVLPGDFNLPVYTDIYVKTTGTVGLSRFTDDYKNRVDAIGKTITTTVSNPEFRIPNVMALSLSQNEYFMELSQNCDRVDAIGQVFPLIFFLVAVLVSLTGMTRMVENDRRQLGILKSLGFKRGPMVAKYTVYAALAAVIGSGLGFLIGFPLFPRVIGGAYNSVLYHLPPLSVPFHFGSAAAAGGVMGGCTILPAAAVCLFTLRERPAMLTLPKAPKPGKRILLERVRPLWRRLGFMPKVTLRNIFRYKKRLLMTFVGVAGCTALLFTGFGLRDSINGVAPLQFEQIRHYDMAVTMASGATSSDTVAVQASMRGVQTSAAFMQEAVNITFGSITKQAELDVPADKDAIRNFITIREHGSHKDIPLTDGGVVLSEKLAAMLSVKIGDTVTLMDLGNKQVAASVTGICENYLYHYVYMDAALYEKLFGAAPVPNQILATLDNVADAAALSASLLQNSLVASVDTGANTRAAFDKVVTSLIAVVLVLIISAMALAFVVLFSLTGINIDERERELATIKVLGFTPLETAAYVFRETMLLTVIGALGGLGLGVLLHQYVIRTAEVDMVMFVRTASFWSYLWAFLLTLAFSGLVSVFMSIRLKRIKMAESMKSVE